jgi:hypothetical protein
VKGVAPGQSHRVPRSHAPVAWRSNTHPAPLALADLVRRRESSTTATGAFASDQSRPAAHLMTPEESGSTNVDEFLHQCRPKPTRRGESGRKISQKFPQVMSSPQPRGMNRYEANHGHHKEPLGRPEWPQIPAGGGPTSECADPPPTQPNRPPRRQVKPRNNRARGGLEPGSRP